MKKSKKKSAMSNVVMQKKGFSLIEVLISLAILTLGIATISMLMVSNMKNSSDSRSEMIASGLAQEAIELVRNFKENDPTGFTGAGGQRSGDYRVDINTSFATFSTGAPYLLYLPASGGFYNHSSGNPTKFNRKVNISNNVLGKTITVTSFVSWHPDPTTSFLSCTLGNKCVSISSIMTDTE